MEFRLTYEGQLLAETNCAGEVRRARADHKQEIRRAFHPQLKRLWEISPLLRPREMPSQRPGTRALGRPGPEYSIEKLSLRFARFGYNFVPLATQDLELLCDINVLFLRRGEPGALIRTGDLDNRMKTLFDALSMPKEAGQLGRFNTPSDGENPFFCLLEDDAVITKAAVESDVLLQPVSDPPNDNDARVIVTVRLWPARVNADNIGFA